MTDPTPHPCPYSATILPVIKRHLDAHSPGPFVLDPFAGIGRIHRLRPEYHTVGVEIEPEWASQSAFTLVGDSRNLYRLLLGKPGIPTHFHAVATSCTYGNRMADHHEAKDSSKRNTYRHCLGRELNPANSGGMQWGPQYRILHEQVWREVRSVLVPGGVFVLNVSDHIRKGHVAQVADWHKRYIQSLGFHLVEQEDVETRRQRMGKNGSVRVPFEHVITFRKPK